MNFLGRPRPQGAGGSVGFREFFCAAVPHKEDEMPFSKGQRVVCIHDGQWCDQLGKTTGLRPSKGDIVTVASYVDPRTIQALLPGAPPRYIRLEGFDPHDGYLESLFRPLCEAGMKTLDEVRRRANQGQPVPALEPC